VVVTDCEVLLCFNERKEDLASYAYPLSYAEYGFCGSVHVSN
jgi:hypothetical protein